MASPLLLRLQRAAWLALILAGTTVHAAPQDLNDRRHDNGEPQPVTIQGRFAGFVATLQLSDDGPSDVFAIAPDQRWFAVSSREATAIRVMELRTGVTLRVLRTGGRKISGLSISADSRVVHAIDEQGKPLAWTAATGERVSADEKADGITRIDRLTILRSDEDNPGPDEQKGASGGRKLIGKFLARHGLTEPLSVLPSIEKVVISLDGRYAVVVDGESDKPIQDGYRGMKFYRGMKIWDLRHLSAPVLVKIPDDWCGHTLNSFAFDGHYVVFGTRGGEGDHAYTDSAAFEVRNGTAEPLWHADCTVNHDAPEEISRDTRFYTVGAAPDGPVTVWDLRTARRAAFFEGVYVAPIISADGSTFAVIRPTPDGTAISVLRRGKRRDLRARVDADPQGTVDMDSGAYALSPNGRYFAATIKGATPGEKRSVGVWDTDSARQVGRVEPADDAATAWKIVGVSDTGSVLLLRGQSVFKSGTWNAVSTSEQSLIVPLTRVFRPRCGAIFCDRIIDDFGVVERVPADGKITRDWIKIGSLQGRPGPQSPDGQLIAVYLENDAPFPGFDIIDVATGRALLHDDFFNQFTSDSRYVLSKIGLFPTSYTLREIATGRKMWSLQGTPDLGFVMTFSDGRVRVSPGAEKYVKLVRGFEVKPYDEAARRQFELKGRWEP